MVNNWLFIALWLTVGKVQSADNPGITAAPALQIPIGARALGMGTAFTALASDSSALYYNPAGLGRLNAQELSASFVTGLSDNNLQHMAYAAPIPWNGLLGGGYAGAGGSLLLSQSGSIEVNRTNPDGSFLDSRRLAAGSDFVLTLGYAEKAFFTPVDLKEASYGVSHFFGISGKFIRSTLVEEYSAQAFSGDAGYLAHSPEAGLAFGLSAANIGGKLRYINEADPLPKQFRAGLAYRPKLSSIGALTISADGQYLAHERKPYANLGVEYLLLKTCRLRFGYQFLRDVLGLTAGFGVAWRLGVILDYAWSVAGGLNDSHRFTVSYRFGAVSQVAAQSPKLKSRRSAWQTPASESIETQDLLEPAPKRKPSKPSGHEDLLKEGWIY